MASVLENAALGVILVIVGAARLLLGDVDAGVVDAPQVMVLADDGADAEAAALVPLTAVAHPHGGHGVIPGEVRVAVGGLDADGASFEDLASRLFPLVQGA